VATDPVPPTGPWQGLVADAWSEVLGYPRHDLAASDDFFELGGHSLAAGRVAGRLGRRTGLAVQIRLLYDNPVLSDLATALATIDSDR
jgi:hypothetical protein